MAYLTDAMAAFGTLLKVGDGGGTEVFTTLAEVVDISGPNLTADLKEATNHSSTGGWKEFIPCLLDGGEVTLEINWIPSNATHRFVTSGLGVDYAAKTKRNFQVIWPDNPGGTGTTWSFAAFIMDYKPAAPTDGKLTASITLRITGQPTLA